MPPRPAPLALAAILLATAAASPAPQSPAATPARPTHQTPVIRPKPGPAALHRPTPAVVRAPHPAPRPPLPAAAPPPPEPAPPPEPTKGSNSGQPLPRFATLRSDDVNMRSGPGTRYPIDWVYKRRDLPVEIEREFEVWRLIRDQEGVKGWVHQAVLAPRRTGVVVNGEHVLRAAAKDDAAEVARLKPGVIVRLRSCDANADWCQAGIQDYRGWMKRSDLWGTYPGEAIQ